LQQEEEFSAEGTLDKDKVLILDKKMINSLEQKGYGEESQKKFFLKPFESLYLLYSKKLKVTKGTSIMNFDTLLQTLSKYDESIITKFLIYRDLKNRGYIVKDGFGFGSDFRVYERGQFGQKGAKYLIFGFNEGTQDKMGQFQKKIEQITKMGKEPIVAVIERRGEVIYYKVSKMNFYENKERVKLETF
jgi:tRNA-intron endonuclease